MNLLYWCLVSFLFQLNFGFWPGLLLTIIEMIVLNILVAHKVVVKDQAMKKIRDENVLVNIEKTSHNGEIVYLVFLEPNNKFVCQGPTANDIAKILIAKYGDKNILSWQNGELTVIHESKKI